MKSTIHMLLNSIGDVKSKVRSSVLLYEGVRL